MLHYYNLTLKENLTGVGFSLQDFKTWKKKLLQVYPPNNVPDRGPIPLEGIIANIYRNMNDQMKRHPTLERKDLKLKSLTQTLKTIIGMEYFGTTSNRNRFFYIVTRILTQNYGECIHMSNLYENFVVEGFSWIDRSKKMDVQIFRANILLLETVVKPFINHYCCFIYMYRHREYLVVLRGDADSFKDKNLAQSIKQGFLEKVPSHKARPKCAIGILTFIPKKNIKMYIHRPLLKLFASKKSLNITIKVNLNKLTKEYQLETHPDLFQRWKIFLMSKRYSNKLYAIKVDLVDAFGMIDTDVLKSIIIKDDKHLTAFQKDLLIKTIGRSYFYVRGKKILYKWHHGLLQGSTLSPILCDLYLSYLTYNYLRSFNTPNTFLHRTVDDILFITVNEYMLNDFEVAIFTMSILNEGKTHKYIDPKIDDPRIVFCGKVFNLETKETSSAFNFPKGRELRGRFKIWNINKQFSTTQAKEFVFNALSFQYLNFYFSPFELNTIGNTASTVLKNIFHGMCFVAFKFYYVISSIDYLFESPQQRHIIAIQSIDFVASSYSPIINKKIKQNKGNNYEPAFSLRVIMFLCFKAFALVLTRGPQKYRTVVKELKNRTKYKRYLSQGCKMDLKFVSKLPAPFEGISFNRKMTLGY